MKAPTGAPSGRTQLTINDCVQFKTYFPGAKFKRSIIGRDGGTFPFRRISRNNRKGVNRRREEQSPSTIPGHGKRPVDNLMASHYN